MQHLAIAVLVSLFVAQSRPDSVKVDRKELVRYQLAMTIQDVTHKRDSLNTILLDLNGQMKGIEQFMKPGDSIYIRIR